MRKWREEYLWRTQCWITLKDHLTCLAAFVSIPRKDRSMLPMSFKTLFWLRFHHSPHRQWQWDCQRDPVFVQRVSPSITTSPADHGNQITKALRTWTSFCKSECLATLKRRSDKRPGTTNWNTVTVECRQLHGAKGLSCCKALIQPSWYSLGGTELQPTALREVGTVEDRLCSLWVLPALDNVARELLWSWPRCWSSSNCALDAEEEREGDREILT
jgi:hypothetical protein